jgi:hypothetical protein
MELSADDRTERPQLPRRRSASWLALLLAAALIAAGAYYAYTAYRAPPAPQAAAPAAPATPVTAAPAAAPAEAPQYPIEKVQAEPAAAPVALKLDDSDEAARSAVASVVGAPRFAQFFVPDNLIRRIVATVDNLPRERAAQRLMPVKPVPGPMAVDSTADGPVIAAANDARYAPYVALLDAVYTRKLVATYVQLYPLLQQAYRELGYPRGNFNDRVVQAIDDALAAPQPPGPLRLVQPKVLYEFAEPRLEGLSAGQKIMLRIGPANAARVKAKLREIRQALAGQPPRP